MRSNRLESTRQQAKRSTSKNIQLIYGPFMASGVVAGNVNLWFHGGGGGGYRGLLDQSHGWWRLGFRAGGLEMAGVDGINL